MNNATSRRTYLCPEPDERKTTRIERHGEAGDVCRRQTDTDRQRDRQIVTQSDSQTDSDTDRQTHRQTVKLTADSDTDSQTDRQTDRQSGQAGRPVRASCPSFWIETSPGLPKRLLKNSIVIGY